MSVKLPDNVNSAKSTHALNSRDDCLDMAETAIDPDLDMIIASMRDDFIADAMDKLEEIDTALDAIDDDVGKYENHLLDVKRITHSIKGLGGSFGFTSISRIAHALEDFLEASGSHGRIPVPETRAHTETMRRVLVRGNEPPEEETAMLLDTLPAPVQPGAPAVKKFKGKAVLLLPNGVQRKIIARELNAFGLRTTVFDDPLHGMDFALSGATDLLITTMQMKRMTGLELARALSAFDRTRHVKVAVLTADSDQIGTVDLPNNTNLIAKGPSFGKDMMQYLTDAGFN